MMLKSHVNICLDLMKEGEGRESFSQLYNYCSVINNDYNTTAATYIILQYFGNYYII